jgi:hypothetical protein
VLKGELWSDCAFTGWLSRPSDCGVCSGEGVLRPAAWPLTDAAYEVLDPALPPPAEPELKESPRGEDDVDEVLACDWIWGRAGSRSLDTAGLGA